MLGVGVVAGTGSRGVEVVGFVGVGVVAGTGRGVEVVGFEVLRVMAAVCVCWDISR